MCIIHRKWNNCYKQPHPLGLIGYCPFTSIVSAEPNWEKHGSIHDLKEVQLEQQRSQVQQLEREVGVKRIMVSQVNSKLILIFLEPINTAKGNKNYK